MAKSMVAGNRMQTNETEGTVRLDSSMMMVRDEPGKVSWNYRD